MIVLEATEFVVSLVNTTLAVPIEVVAAIPVTVKIEEDKV